jgi:hypothetical protein
MTPEENALRIYIEKLEKENSEMKILFTKNGFFKEYFKKLKTAKNNIEAFNEINERYHELFGKYRYSDYNTFKRMSNYYNNKK